MLCMNLWSYGLYNYTYGVMLCMNLWNYGLYALME
ncbi:unnamed protein product [Brassica rapa subsp. narinosa]